MKNAVFLASILGSLIAISPVQAAPVTGTYSTEGATTGTGPWTLTSTDSTYSILLLTLDTPVNFSDLASISVSYTNNLGGIGQGAPRLFIVTDSDHNNSDDGFFRVHWGAPGTLADPTLGAGSTGNLLALTDVGRYDLGGVGGSAYTDRAAALALAGNYAVLQIGITIDSYGGADRNFTINGISVDSIGGAVPEPATWGMMILGFGLVGATMRRRTVTVAFA